MTTPDFAAIGHVVRDLTASGWRLGGTVAFAAVQAQRLGLNAGIVTRGGEDLTLGETLPNVALAGRPSVSTTSFENIYDGPHRRQRVPTRAEAIDERDVPASWRDAHVVLLGPVCGEVAAGLARAFSDSLVGVSAQGWLRDLDEERVVRRRAWGGAPFWSDCHVLFVSEEDLEHQEEALERWAQDVPVVVMTRERRGAEVRVDGTTHEIAAFPAAEVDPTGAGDVFAAAFLVRYDETEDVDEAARFAASAASCSVEAAGVDAIADREAIVARMAAHPHVVLR